MLFQVFKKVFGKATYTLFASAISVTIFAFAVWLPNISLIIRIMGHPGVSLSQKLDLPINLLGSIITNFTILSASYTIMIAILFGVNLAMIVYFLRRRVSDMGQSGFATGFLGIASGIVGMGCAACGSLLLTSILSLFSATWILSFLPLGGGEFGILGVIILAVSVYLTAKRIQNPAVCSI